MQIDEVENISGRDTCYKRELLILFALWLVPTLINLNKAFHIDDTFHLEAAKWIAKHPTEPMSAMVNWYDDPEPISHANQPPLYFYLIACWGSIFGFSEIPLHIMQSLFTFLSIWLFHRIASVFSREHAIALTAILAMNAAFVVNQNLMTDVPLLSMLLAMVYMLVRTDEISDARRYGWAAGALSVGLLIKYSLLPMLPVLAFIMIYDRKYRQLLFLLLPVAALGLWSVWNYIEFGSSHLLNRNAGVPLTQIADRANSMLLATGAVSFFAVLAIQWPGVRNRRLVAWLTGSGVVMFAGLLLLVYSGKVVQKDATNLLRNLFGVKAALILLSAVVSGVYTATATHVDAARRRQYAIVVVWLAAVFVFIVRFAPFIATRHVLLILPAIILLLSPFWERAATFTRAAVLGGTVLMGVVLGLSDRAFADFYRTAAADYGKFTDTKRVWSVGHWGWQWYCNGNGVPTLGVHTSEVKDGDEIIAPHHVAKQDVRGFDLTKVRSYYYPTGILSFFSVSEFAGFYSTTANEIPWVLSKIAVDSVEVFTVNKK
ncbi:MAG: glycosyltransferase family 39 protein [Chitinophagaceae bacterium]|nr:glycosyltransferase family 39 protein [Chitinophagaceae bacterium]